MYRGVIHASFVLDSVSNSIQVYRPPRVLRRRKETAEGAEEKVNDLH